MEKIFLGHNQELTIFCRAQHFLGSRNWAFSYQESFLDVDCQYCTAQALHLHCDGVVDYSGNAAHADAHGNRHLP